MKDHDNRGNCWAKAQRCRKDGCRPGTLCDVCHEHHEPRGECDLCPVCPECAAGNEEEGDNA